MDITVEVGGAGTLPRSFLATRLGGRIAVIGLLTGAGAQVDPMPILRRNLRVQGLYVGNKQMFEAMNRAIEAGGLKPVIDKVFPFAEAKEAYRHLKSQNHFGKIVISARAIPSSRAAGRCNAGVPVETTRRAPSDGRRSMKNLWSDSDAKAAIAQHAAKGIGEDLALRVYTTRLLGGEPRLVLHGGGNTSVKTTDGRHHRRDDRRAVRQGQRLGHGHDRGARPAGGAARAAARNCVGLQALSATRTWSTSSAATCWTASRPTRRSRRCCTPSCRTSSSTTRIPTPCWR